VRYAAAHGAIGDAVGGTGEASLGAALLLLGLTLLRRWFLLARSVRRKSILPMLDRAVKRNRSCYHTDMQKTEAVGHHKRSVARYPFLLM